MTDPTPEATPDLVWFSLAFTIGGKESEFIVSAQADDPEDIESKLAVLVEKTLRRVNGGDHA